MSDVDFNTILDTPAEEIKARPPIPAGTYDFRIKGQKAVKSSRKGTDGVEFAVVPFQPGDDVDAELLAEAGGLDREMSITFWVTPESANMLKEFLSLHCKIEAEGKTLRQLLAESTNQGFRGIVTHELSQKTQRPYATIAQTLPIE